MTAVKMKEQSLPLPRPAKEPIIEIIDSDSDGEEIQVTKVKFSQKQKTDNLIREAIWFYRENNYKSALEKLEAVFALDQNNVMALVALGVNTYRLGDSDQACKLLTRALDLSPNHIDAIIAKATILCNNEDIDGSLGLLERGLKMYPKQDNENTLIRDPKYKKAMSYFRQIAELKAQNYLKDRNEPEAIKMYEKIIQFDPESPENIGINKILVSLRRKASGDPRELVCLSSDEEEDVKSEIPLVISRDIFRDISDDDQEETQMDNSYKERISQFLKKIDRSESKDLSDNQKKTLSVEKKTRIETRLLEGQRDKYKKELSDIISNDIPESHECQNVIRYDNELEKAVTSGSLNLNEIENSSKSPSKNLKKHDLISHEDNTLNTKVKSPEKESTNNKTTENPTMAPSENLKKIDLTKRKEDDNLQTNLNSVERESTNNKTPDNNEVESSPQRQPKKRSLPKLKRLPIGYMVENNSLHTMRPQHSQVIRQEEESSKMDQTKPGMSNEKKNNESQADRSNDKKLSNSRSANNLYHSDIIENETEYSGEDSDNFEYQNTEEALFDRGKSYEEKKNLRKTQESKTEENNDTRGSKLKNTQEETQDTQKISRKQKHVDKNRDNRKNKKEEAVQIKSSSSGKHEISNKDSEKRNERSKNKKNSDKSHQQSSKSSRNSFKQLPKEQKKEDKSRKSSKKHHQSDEESDVETDIFGVNANSINITGLDDLPDIETSHTKCYDQQEKDVNKSEEEDEEYDELRELQKDIERNISIEDEKSKKQATENQKRKGIDFNNVKSKKTCDFLESLRQENEKTEKTTNKLPNRLTREIQRNTAKNTTATKETDGRRRIAILLTDPIVPPSEIRKRRRKRNGNGYFHDDEEETPKKKYVRKTLNSEFPSEAIAEPSNVQETPILSTPVKEPSVEIRTPTHKPSSGKKESLPGPRGKSKDFLFQVLCSRHASVRKEFKHLDEGDISDLAENIESELYNLFNGDTGKEYKTKLRSLHFNIKDPKNETLFRKILNRKVSPKRLVRMDKKELASEELARWQEMRQKQSIDAIIETEREKVLTSNCQVILKNHKGDLPIENDYAREALDTLNELPEDLSIDLNIKSSSGNKNKKEKNRHKTSRR